MSDEFDWNFVDEDDAKAEIRAAVQYLLRGATGALAVISCRRSLRSCAMPRAIRRIRWTMAFPADELARF